jgi:coenzyme F420-0:L-glutamate ligase/coenzyme F420-1:gamma-L-glutamate ligase
MTSHLHARSGSGTICHCVNFGDFETMPTEPCRSLSAFAIPGFPIVEQGDDLVEAILLESTEIVGTGPNIIVAEHHCGVVLANAGIDRSNVGASVDDSVVLLLPREPDCSCRKIRQGLLDRLGVDVCVIINDSLGRPWRQGTIGTAIGASGVPALLDLRGRPDLFGRMLMVSQEAIADEIAATAQLIQGQAGEGQPIVVIRGRFNWDAPERSAASLLRPKSDDLFR